MHLGFILLQILLCIKAHDYEQCSIVNIMKTVNVFCCVSDLVGSKDLFFIRYLLCIIAHCNSCGYERCSIVNIMKTVKAFFCISDLVSSKDLFFFRSCHASKLAVIAMAMNNVPL